MEEKKQSIFRKQSLERISSPEELDNYLAVTGPGVWFPLLAVVALLIGALVWMFLGHLDTTLNVAVVSDENGVVCYVPAEKIDAALKGGSVAIAEKEYPISDEGRSVQLVTEDTDVNLRIAGELAEGAAVKPLRVDADLQSGIYEGEIVVETINPIKFIIN